MTSLNSLLCNPRNLPDGTGSSEKGRWGPRGRIIWRTEEIHDSGNSEGMLFIWGGTVSFWARWPGLRKACGVFNRCSECHPVVLCHLQWEQKSNYQTSPDHFFKRVGFLISAWNQNLCRQCQEWVKLQLALWPLLLAVLQFYHPPRPLPPPFSCLFTHCSCAYASCWAVLLYF